MSENILSRQQIVSYTLHPEKSVIFYLLLEPMSQSNQVVSWDVQTASVLTCIPLNKGLFGKNTSFQYNHLAYHKKRNLLAVALQSKKFLLFDLDNQNRILIQTEFKG